MRNFGSSEVNYFEFQIEGSEKVYRIPLAANMPFMILKEMNDTAGTGDGFIAQIDMLRKYMGDVVDDLSAGILSEILLAWSEESKNAGASVGES